uniref:Uncharacterized protein n=1 Tax=Chromera velia CCMP2878 TaxID=1169474 RepID=A0A0K6S8M6_9ALVE|eukprot:Cvel_25554.t1-p1 / transcript=Cvel_25554.t1 / gene=Cvel_25554 / organism=Chromera_velia_CCMP2878 / gene_product=hypothetical protein / transcript_product=hypothetical protein / location=Cvel_scaffold2910:4110-5158(+) / protein_length=279 / sequence_SO=supercontig / SO=protein_coding / is_pseudo=false
MAPKQKAIKKKAGESALKAVPPPPAKQKKKMTTTTQAKAAAAKVKKLKEQLEAVEKEQEAMNEEKSDKGGEDGGDEESPEEAAFWSFPTKAAEEKDKATGKALRSKKGNTMVAFLPQLLKLKEDMKGIKKGQSGAAAAAAAINTDGEVQVFRTLCGKEDEYEDDEDNLIPVIPPQESTELNEAIAAEARELKAIVLYVVLGMPAVEAILMKPPAKKGSCHPNIVVLKASELPNPFEEDITQHQAKQFIEDGTPQKVAVRHHCYTRFPHLTLTFQRLSSG